MIRFFSQKNHADVASCIERYGARSNPTSSLARGVDRLCRHVDELFDDRYVFLVVLGNMHQQKITAHQLINELETAIARTYLHIPDHFDFKIGDKKMSFKWWPSRLVELSVFTVVIHKKLPWQQKMDQYVQDEKSYLLRVFIGFDGLRITEPSAGKEGSLYVYSRQSGRLISHQPDARTLLSLSAGGTVFCQGLTVIVDDLEGHLPLSPTKQELSFGEETHGEIHQKNLMAWVGAVVHFYYQHHSNKFKSMKTVLTRKIANFGDVLLSKNPHQKILNSSSFTTYKIKSFKSIGENIRVDKRTVREIVGADTLYRLVSERSSSDTAPKSVSKGSKRKSADHDTDKIRRKRIISCAAQSVAYGENTPLQDHDMKKQDVSSVLSQRRLLLNSVVLKKKEEGECLLMESLGNKTESQKGTRGTANLSNSDSDESKSQKNSEQKKPPLQVSDLELTKENVTNSEKQPQKRARKASGQSNSESDVPENLKTPKLRKTHLRDTDREIDEVNKETSGPRSNSESKLQLEVKSSPNESDNITAGQVTGHGKQTNADECSDPYTKEWYRNMCDHLTKKTNRLKSKVKSLKDELRHERNLRQNMQQQIQAQQKK